MGHMGQDERRRIEFMLGCGDKVADMAKALGRSESTISRELLSRHIDSDKEAEERNLNRSIAAECVSISYSSPNAENRRAHNGRGSFRLRSCSATTDD